ncbi:MAG TPA: HAD family hydrolase [Gaiellaceae bacterium]|nr:HAD family hydrolase [Gaiellaceae bacterium]
MRSTRRWSRSSARGSTPSSARRRPLAKAALLDLDGTLVDANYQHALAWYRAFRRYDIVVPMWRVHRHIGMGGDQFVTAVAGEDVERRLGDDLRDASGEEFQKLRDECVPLEGSRELVEELVARGHAVVLASSSNEDDLTYFLDQIGVRDLVQYTTADDVERSKPHPDIVNAALDKAGTRDAVMVGDSRWDIEAAANAGLETVCVITGGWSEQELRDAGAAAVFDSLVALREGLDATPLG